MPIVSASGPKPAFAHGLLRCQSSLYSIQKLCMFLNLRHHDCGHLPFSCCQTCSGNYNAPHLAALRVCLRLKAFSCTRSAALHLHSRVYVLACGLLALISFTYDLLCVLLVLSPSHLLTDTTPHSPLLDEDGAESRLSSLG